MIAKIHKGLTSEKWNSQPMDKRILNIVSELTRAKGLLSDRQTEYLQQSLERVLELMDLTTDSWKEERSFSWLGEFLRLREFVASFYAGSDKNHSDLMDTIHAFLEMEPSCCNLGLTFD